MEGRYSFKQVKADTVSLTISYVSYARQTIEPILVETGKTTVVDIEMAEASIELNTIKVEGFKRTNTNLSMMENTKISFLVVNGISSQQIMKSLDRDAGEVAAQGSWCDHFRQPLCCDQGAEPTLQYHLAQRCAHSFQ